jgi:prepilin-type N-terminal cleavage/methylation domain-containing protein
MMLRHTRSRRGFTLLELLLASLIAALLLGGLYLAMNMTLEQTQASRDASDVEDLHRGVVNRMSVDLAATLGPLSPKFAPLSSTSSGGGETTGDMTGDMAGDMTGDMTDPESMTDPTMTAAALPILPFHGGIYGRMDGENSVLVIFASRVPSVLSTPGALVGGTGAASASDLRRIVYWMGASGGLCREERVWVTADGIGNSDEPDRSNEASNTIVEEVVGFVVEYADGSGGWLDSWNSDPAAAATNGPPRAVRLTLTFEFPSKQRGGSPVTKTLVQVIPIRTAPGTATSTLVDPVVPTTDASSDPASDMGGTGGDGTGGGGTGGGGTGGGGTGGGGTGGKGGGGGAGGGGKGGTGGGGTGGKGGGGFGGGGGGGKGGGGFGGGGGKGGGR